MSSEPRSYYPEIEPFETGMLNAGEAHVICRERVGMRGAKPAAQSGRVAHV